MFVFEKEALVASGLRDDARIGLYQERLTNILRTISPKDGFSSLPLDKAKKLFESLWYEKPNRYLSGGSFRLDEVINTQFTKKDRPVGNCLGLTVLYNCLLKRLDLKPFAFYLPEESNLHPHVLTGIEIDRIVIKIEHMFPFGFDIQDYGYLQDRHRWDDKCLIADIYNSMGNEYFDKGDFTEALRNYNMAIKLNPEYEKAHLNRLILKNRMSIEDTRI